MPEPPRRVPVLPALAGFLLVSACDAVPADGPMGEVVAEDGAGVRIVTSEVPEPGARTRWAAGSEPGIGGWMANREPQLELRFSDDRGEPGVTASGSRHGAGQLQAPQATTSARSGPRREAVDTLFHPTAPGPNHRAAQPGWDVGTGFLRVTPNPAGPPGSAPAETISIHAAPRRSAPRVARTYHEDYRFVVEAAEPGLRDGALEVGYEERALPMFEEGEDARWVRVSFAMDEEGEPRTGWADASADGLELWGWGEWLTAGGGPLHFLDPADIAFYQSPGRARVELALELGAGSRDYDYAMYPIRSDGPWVEVRVVSPSDYCGGPSRPQPPVSETAWIRFLDDAGRPTVWYPTRGC